MKKPRWTDEELVVLKENINKPRKEIASILGRSLNSIEGKIKTLNLSQKCGYVNPSLWSENEVIQLIELSKSKTVKEICLILNRTKYSVIGKIRQLGLNVNKEVSWTEKELDFLKENYNKMDSHEISKKTKQNKEFYYFKGK